ncbi:hypothetical protein TcCL_NonESM09083 [Trypanosoma cruzi]|nr:hypothetical protein TcCL_NonESM09083 [Trypanosoma cruzi]
MLVAQMPRGACGLWLLWTERMMRGKRDAVQSSSISVGGYTSHAIPSDRLQQRPSPSVAVGAFLLHRGATPPTQSLAHSPTNTERGSNSMSCDTCDKYAAAESHCSRNDQTKKARISSTMKIQELLQQTFQYNV